MFSAEVYAEAAAVRMLSAEVYVGVAAVAAVTLPPVDHQ